MPGPYHFLAIRFKSFVHGTFHGTAEGACDTEIILRCAGNYRNFAGILGIVRRPKICSFENGKEPPPLPGKEIR
jgi:hypothetical protein